MELLLDSVVLVIYAADMGLYCWMDYRGFYGWDIMAGLIGLWLLWYKGSMVRHDWWTLRKEGLRRRCQRVLLFWCYHIVLLMIFIFMLLKVLFYIGVCSLFPILLCLFLPLLQKKKKNLLATDCYWLRTRIDGLWHLIFWRLLFMSFIHRLGYVTIQSKPIISLFYCAIN